MLYEAACWRPGVPHPPREEVLRDPHLTRYLEGWGREGDAAIIALHTGALVDEPVGAAWYRLFSPQEPGYGFLDAAIPEVSVGVAPGFRGRGAGRALLETLMDAAREEGFDALSLSVERDNPALRLYGRLGFEKVSFADGSWTMRAEL